MSMVVLLAAAVQQARAGPWQRALPQYPLHATSAPAKRALQALAHVQSHLPPDVGQVQPSWLQAEQQRAQCWQETAR